MSTLGPGVEKQAGETWYTDAQQYWKNVEPTVNGMLGGFEQLSEPDVAASNDFLRKLPDLGRNYVVDCGAGIGRVTKGLLLDWFNKVDLVEQNPDFLAQAKKVLPSDRIGDYFAVGLQEFNPPVERYDVIWVQWVSGHLRDDHFVEFLERCKSGLRSSTSYIIFKENIANAGVVVDEVDSSVTRSDSLLKILFAKANLRLVKEVLQPNFPKGMFKVKMYALQRASS